jgi:predicted flavoprotein YhiN
LQEAAHAAGTPLAALDGEAVARLVKSLPVRVTGLAPIDRAISTAGGVAFDEIDEDFMLRKRPGTFVAGEMLDWEAPTGGYLLQACFATGRAAGEGALAYLARKESGETG